MPPDKDIIARHHYLATMPPTDHRSDNANSPIMADTDQQLYSSINIDGIFNADALSPKTLSPLTSPPTTPSDQGHDVNNRVVDCPFRLHSELFQGSVRYKVVPQDIWQMMPYHKSIDGGQASLLGSPFQVADLY